MQYIWNKQVNTCNIKRTTILVTVGLTRTYHNNKYTEKLRIVGLQKYQNCMFPPLKQKQIHEIMYWYTVHFSPIFCVNIWTMLDLLWFLYFAPLGCIYYKCIRHKWTRLKISNAVRVLSMIRNSSKDMQLLQGSALR